MTRILVVVTFDPGVTTGYVVAAVAEDPELRKTHAPQPLEWGEIKWDDRFIRLTQIFDQAGRCDVQQVIIESFNLYPHAAQYKIGSAFPEIRMIGIIEAFVALHGLSGRLLWQSPAQAKSIKRFPPTWIVPPSAHTQDALRHLRYWWIMISKGRAPDGETWSGTI